MGLKNLRKDESGATAVIVGILMAVLLGMLAMVIDMGRGYTLKANMQSACDLAAMSGAKELAKNQANTSGAKLAAEQYAVRNGFKLEDVDVKVIDSTRVRVSIRNTQKNLFGGAVGVNSLNVACSATASVDEMEGDIKDFPYSLFSGSTTQNLVLTGGGYEVYGGIHSNAGMSFGAGHTDAYSFSAVKGGSYDWNCYTLVDNGDNTYTRTQITPTSAVPIGSIIDMPYYLGDNIEAIITPPPTVEASHWTKTAKPDSLWSASAAFYTTLNSGGNVKISGNGYWSMAGSATINHHGDMLIETSGSTTFAAPGVCEIYGDVYIKNPTGTTSFVNYNWANGKSSVTHIYGNVYCEGNLTLANTEIHGNLYCTGKLSNSGAGCGIYGTYIYANSIETANSMDVSGTVVTEGDIKLYGNHVNASNGGNDSLSFYSKHGNVVFTTGSHEVHGILFAPEGNIQLNSSLTFYGKIIGNTLALGGNGGGTGLKVYPLDMELPYETTPNPDSPKDKKKVVRLIE